MGGSQAAIWRVNCLGSEDIRAGADLFVPPLPAASIGGGTASSTGSTAVMPFAGIAAALSDIEPGGGVCPPAFLAVLPEGANFGIVTMAPTCSLADSVWEVGEQICLYPRGLDTSQPVTLTITAPKGDSTSYSLLPGNHWMRWSLLPGIARGIYTVEAVQDGTQIAGAVNVTDPFRPKILVQTDEVPSGGEIEAALSGFLANQPLFLYRYDPSRSEWALSRQLPTPQLGRSGEGYYTATIEGPAGSYAVHTGAAGSVCSGVDPRVFSVK
jgi:hypothetical protein